MIQDYAGVDERLVAIIFYKAVFALLQVQIGDSQLLCFRINFSQVLMNKRIDLVRRQIGRRREYDIVAAEVLPVMPLDIVGSNF